MPPCLTFSNISYISRVKWSKERKEYHPPLHLCVVAIEKGAFWSPPTTVANNNKLKMNQYLEVSMENRFSRHRKKLFFVEQYFPRST